MKLLTNDDYNKVEYYLTQYNKIIDNCTYDKALTDIITFFNDYNYRILLETFYLYRGNYKNRYPSNSSIFRYLSKKLYVQEPTLYAMRKEIIYKSAMIFYKYDLM